MSDLQEAEGRLAMIAAGMATKKGIRREDARILRKELAHLRERVSYYRGMTTDDRAQAVVSEEKL